MMTQARVECVRLALSEAGLDGYLVPRADEHLGEYVPPSGERLAWLTGFTGSAGLAVVLRHEAAAFTDGRYTLQMAAEVDAEAWQRLHITDQPPIEWAAARAKRLGYDPWLMSEETVERWEAAGITMVPVANLVDACWTDRPAAPATPVALHPDRFAGRSAADKLAELAEALRGAGQAACVLTDPASICWLLNIRGADLPYVPLALSFAIVHATRRVDVFIQPGRVDAAVRGALGPAVTVLPPESFAAGLSALAGQVVRVDRAGSPFAVTRSLRAAGASVVAGTDPCVLPRACKNAVEQDGARAAQIRDAVAVCRFLHWLDHAREQTEMSAAAQLLAFRRDAPGFRGESFPAISGAGEHGAVIHYRVSAETDRAIRPDEVYLIDSGGQYEDGTTDITRTVWTGPGKPPAALRGRFTRVLQGNIALAETVFPQGVAGAHLDAVARRPLWAAGLDYDHGTGHGVGSYLSVHEGPVSISRAAKIVAIAPGMILSDEPGTYLPGEYGIRLETLLLVQAAEGLGERRAFLRFEVLTLAPFDRRLIDAALLDARERAWVDRYHARILSQIGPLCPAPVAAWLADACAVL